MSGDAHFRRTENGNAPYNPFVGNDIMDAFTTEIGGEVYLKTAGIVAMAAVTGGEIRGTVLTPGQRGPTLIGKLGFDRQVRKDLRVRLTGSMYKTDKAMSNTLYGGDRAGSRYYYVLENTAATEAAQKDSGLINPGFKNKVTAFQMNPFVKFRGFEVFGVVERATRGVCRALRAAGAAEHARLVAGEGRVFAALATLLVVAMILTLKGKIVNAIRARVCAAFG